MTLISMNKFLFNLLFILFFTPTCFAQKGQPKLGKIDMEDLLMKQCSYDKDAVAFKLIDWGNLYYDRGNSEMLFKTIVEIRQRIKILKEEGLSYANVTIPYYTKNNTEKISKIEAFVYNIDAAGKIEVNTINKNSTYTKKINNFYSDLIIPLPNVKVGSVIEYKYTLERQTMTNIKDWYFQHSIPTRYSEYEVSVPLIFKFSLQQFTNDSVEIKDELLDEFLSSNQGVMKVKLIHKKFIMRNLKALPNEPFMTTEKDYQQRLEFQLSQIDYGKGDIVNLQTNWGDVIKNLKTDEDFGKQLDVEIPKAEQLITSVKLLTTDEQKVQFLFTYFQKNFIWNEKESIYSFLGLKQTWDTKVGSTGDINLLFVKLLKEAGVTAFPILFSTRSNGSVNKLAPFINQFNTVLCVATINNNIVVIDATEKLFTYSLIPTKINNTYGFIVDDNVGKWILVNDSKNKYKSIVAHNGIIDENGILLGESSVYSSGYAKLERLKKWVTNKSEFEDDYFNNKGSIVFKEQIIVNNIDDASKALEQKVNYSYTLNNSGSYKYFTTNYFTDFTINPFLSEERVTDIDFSYLQDYQYFSNFTLSSNYVFDELPKNITMIMPDKSITFNRFAEVEDNVLNIRVTIEFKNSVYPASVYPEFKEFYKEMFEKLNEQIVIKKK